MSALAPLRLPACVAADLRHWSAEGYPVEACGLLVGRRHAGHVEVVRAVQARNLRAGERGDRYEVDPAEHLAAWKAAEAEGLEVVGAWHSHPDQPAIPSATDHTEASAGLSYLIVAVSASGAGELRSWRLVDGAFEEEPLEL